MNTIEINGKTYEAIERKKSDGSMSHVSRMLMAAMPFMAMEWGTNYRRELPKDINVITEFELIEQKKSKLSRWEREQVVHTFNKHFKLTQTLAQQSET